MKAKLIQINPWIWKGPGFIVNTNTYGTPAPGAVIINGGVFILNIKTGEIKLST